MNVACAQGMHRHPPLRRCEGCDAPVSLDDVIHTSSGAHPICDACYERWRRAGYGRKGRAA